ncbi:hypothetical protein BD779DRAFT_1523936 [Infundibulicybe gibba]|nr:hypothetical protein BD779DRAFT_1523936 [Infundibulicybe gibba]
MSSTTTTTTISETQQQCPPELTVLTRVASIPLISSLTSTLSSNPYTRSPYTTIHTLSSTAYKITSPIQVRLAPLITYADGCANRAVDVVESRYPYPFKASPGEVVDLVRERRKNAEEYVAERKDSIEGGVVGAVQGFDQRFAPIMDYIETTLSRFNSGNGEAGPSTPPSPTSESKYQYQRALAISKALKDQIYSYSQEQLKQLQTQSILLQRATETAHSISTLASSSLHSAQCKIHALSDNMLVELQKLQTSTAQMSSSFQSTTSHTYADLSQKYVELSESLATAIVELRTIVTTKEMSVQEKVEKVGAEVKGKVRPVLGDILRGVESLLGRGKEIVQEEEQELQVNESNGNAKHDRDQAQANGTNGNGNGHGPSHSESESEH